MQITDGTRAILTGASRGIGRATAEALASRGARVGLIARGTEELERLAGELGGDPVVLAADVGDRAAIESAIERFVDEAGGIDVAIANAGIAHYGPFVDQPIENSEQMVRVNVLGMLYTAKAVLPHMLDAARGHLVVLSSGAGLRAFPWGATYGATKAADRGFAEALRHELSGTGVSVTAVLPGEVESDLHTHQRERLPDWRRDENTIPATDVADAIVRGIEEDRRIVYVPGLVRALGLNGLAPRLTDRLVGALRGPTAAPRRD
jgi:3-oxoacyl-[acyl-carrier protein] reductase